MVAAKRDGAPSGYTTSPASSSASTLCVEAQFCIWVATCICVASPDPASPKASSPIRDWGATVVVVVVVELVVGTDVDVVVDDGLVVEVVVATGSVVVGATVVVVGAGAGDGAGSGAGRREQPATMLNERASATMAVLRVCMME